MGRVWAAWTIAVVMMGASLPAMAQNRNLRASGLVTPSSPLVAGQMTTFDVTVDSTGAQASGGYQYKLYLTAGGVLTGAVLLGTYSASSIPAGGTVTIARPLTLPVNVTGIYQPALVVDTNDAILEGNELDNAFVSGTQLTIRPRAPDLFVRSADVSARDAQEGTTVSIDVELANDGELPASVVVAAYLSRGPTVSISDVLLGETTVDAQLTGGSGTIVAAIPSGLIPGDYTLGLIIDPDQLTGDRRPIDNVWSFTDPFNVWWTTLAIDTETVTDGTLGSAYEVRLASSGGDGHYRYTVSAGSLPNGLVLGQDGILSGTPARTGEYDFTVRVDSHGLSTTKAYQSEIHTTNEPLEIAVLEAHDGFLLMPYEQIMIASGGEPPYTWFVDPEAADLPPGLDLSTDGAISGLPSVLGTFTFTLGVRDRLGAIDMADYRVVITPTAGVLVLLSMPPPLPVGVATDFPLQATGGRGPYVWTALSSPPPGLTVTEDGHLRGTPDQVGTYRVLVRASGSGRKPTSDEALIQIVVEEAGVFTVKTKALPPVLIRDRYETFLEAEGGTPPYSWRVVPGTTLLEGFYFTEEGAPEGQARIYGVAYSPQTQAFAVRVKDAQGRQREVALALSVPRVEVGVDTQCTCTTLPRTTGRLGLVALLSLGLALRRRH